MLEQPVVDALLVLNYSFGVIMIAGLAFFTGAWFGIIYGRDVIKKLREHPELLETKEID